MPLLAAAAFIGSQSCRPCHPAISETYAATPMARSSGRVETITPAAFTAAGHRYSISGNRLNFDGNSVPMDFFIGSGAAGQSYLLQRAGYLFELPVTWYTANRKWDASPGYEQAAAVQLNRAVEPSCLACHASLLRPVLGTANRYGDPPFAEPGVACERCHGPGGQHARDPAHAAMVNPAKLDPERRDSVCAQCHLTGEARIELPGRRILDYRAGERLSSYASYLVWTSSTGLKVTSHVEKLAASVCKQASGDALWCGSCHDPHTNRDKTQAACLNCHATAHHTEEACAGCHMPKSRVVDGGHGVLTDHSIPRIPGAAVKPIAARELKPFIGEATDRSLGLAYASLNDPRAPAYLKRAQPVDAPVQLWLAALATDPERAAPLYRAVLLANPSEVTALVNLGGIEARAGRVEEAAKLWQRALAANPAIEAAALNLASIRPPNEARAILQRYLEFDPGSLTVQKRLAALPPQVLR